MSIRTSEAERNTGSTGGLERDGEAGAAAHGGNAAAAAPHILDRQRLEYMCEMVLELQMMAASADMKGLAAALALAYAEADRLADQGTGREIMRAE